MPLVDDRGRNETWNHSFLRLCDTAYLLALGIGWICGPPEANSVRRLLGRFGGYLYRSFMVRSLTSPGPLRREES